MREIWDGNRVIRQSGESQTEEFVYPTPKHVPSGYGTPTVQDLYSAINRGEFRLAMQASPLERLRFWRSWNPDAEGMMIRSYDKNGEQASRVQAPNLTLNIPKAIPTGMQIWIFTSIGLVVQLAVLAFNALAVYYWNWSRAGYAVALYGYPVWAVGTICITVGVCLCAHVVEMSTKEITIEPKSSKHYHKKGDPTFGIVRLQRSIPSLGLEAFAIFNDEDNSQVRISRRTLLPPEPKARNKKPLDSDADLDIYNLNAEPHVASDKVGILTVMGTFLTLAGFICQNVGTRELHWSGGVSQLIATLILTFLRALARRHVGDTPPDYAILPLKAGFEASQLASRVHNLDRWAIFSETHIPETAAPLPSVISGETPLPRTIVVVKPPLLLDLLRDTDQIRRLNPRRALQTQKLFSEFQPNGTEITNIASSVCQSFEAILQLFNVDVREASWDQLISFKESSPSASNEIVQYLRLSADNGTIQGILSLSVYSYWYSSKSFYSIHIVGYCDDNEEAFQQKYSLMQKLLYNRIFHRRRARDGKTTVIIDSERNPMDTVSNREIDLPDHVLGMSYSALRYNQDRLDQDRLGLLDRLGLFSLFLQLDVTLLTLYRYTGLEIRDSTKIELLTTADFHRSHNALLMFALELVSGLILHLVSSNRDQVSKMLQNSKTTKTGESWKNDLFEKMGRILTANELAGDDDCLIWIVPAFVQEGLLPPDPTNEGG